MNKYLFHLLFIVMSIFVGLTLNKTNTFATERINEAISVNDVGTRNTPSLYFSFNKELVQNVNHYDTSESTFSINDSSQSSIAGEGRTDNLPIEIDENNSDDLNTMFESWKETGITEKITMGKNSITFPDKIHYPFFSNFVDDHSYSFKWGSSQTSGYYGNKVYSFQSDKTKYYTTTDDSDEKKLARVVSDENYSGIQIAEILFFNPRTLSFEHEVYFKNKTTKTMSPAKYGVMLDTMLDDKDNVPIYATGTGGVYIESPDKSLVLYIEGMENSIVYAGKYDERGKISGRVDTNKPAGTVLKEATDTAVVYETPDEFELKPNEIIKMKFRERLIVQVEGVTVKYVDEDGAEIHSSQTVSGEVGDEYDVTTPQYKLDIAGYTLDESRLPDNSKGVIKEDTTCVTYVYKKNVSIPEAIKTYTNLTSGDGKNRVGDELAFTLTAKNPTGNVSWDDVTISDVLPQELDIEPTSIQVMDPEGKVTALPETAYNEQTREVKSDLVSVPKQKSVSLFFKAIINERTSGQTIINKMLAESDANHSVTDEVTIEVESGSLTFLSAPRLLDFGNNLKLSTKEQEYPLQLAEGDSLQIQDTCQNTSWKVTGKLTKEFTGTQGQVVKGILHYRSPGQAESIFSSEASIMIAEHQTTDEAVIDLSQEWTDVTNGPVLVVPPGRVEADSYDAQIQWTLEDVPVNE